MQWALGSTKGRMWEELTKFGQNLLELDCRQDFAHAHNQLISGSLCMMGRQYLICGCEKMSKALLSPANRRTDRRIDGRMDEFTDVKSL